MLSQEKFDPTINYDGSLSVQDVSAALKQVCDDSLVFTTEMKQPTVIFSCVNGQFQGSTPLVRCGSF